jgi:hypothetical protein
VAPELSRLQWTAVGAVWLVAAFGTGAALAWLYRRLYPGLSFHRLWAFWTVIVSMVAAVIFGFGLV